MRRSACSPFLSIKMEDLYMVLSVYARMKGMDPILGLPVYFCIDSLLMVYPPLQTLYRCEVCDAGNIKVVKVDVLI